MNSSISDLTVPQLKRAVLIKQKIERLKIQLAAILGTGTADKPIRARRNMSAAAKARISAAQKRRWAKFHAQQGHK